MNTYLCRMCLFYLKPSSSQMMLTWTYTMHGYKLQSNTTWKKNSLTHVLISCLLLVSVLSSLNASSKKSTLPTSNCCFLSALWKKEYYKPVVWIPQLFQTSSKRYGMVINLKSPQSNVLKNDSQLQTWFPIDSMGTYNLYYFTQSFNDEF